MTIAFNKKIKITYLTIGYEKSPLLIIDDLVETPELLITAACSEPNPLLTYQAQTSNYYPGIRKETPASYRSFIEQQLLPYFRNHFTLNKIHRADTIMSAFSLTTTPVAQLRPIQMLPHFDTSLTNQLAMVHYLCDEGHGGTAFYRHNSSQFERITNERLSAYRITIKQQAIAEKLHENPHYVTGNSALFTQIHAVKAKMNRAIIYPSNLLHSGNIHPETDLFADPRKGRLTISSFILIR